MQNFCSDVSCGLQPGRDQLAPGRDNFMSNSY